MKLAKLFVCLLLVATAGCAEADDGILTERVEKGYIDYQYVVDTRIQKCFVFTKPNTYGGGHMFETDCTPEFLSIFPQHKLPASMRR